MNAREELEAAMTWLGYQNEDLSFGLKSAEDALKLWRAWIKVDTHAEFCDEPETEEEARETAKFIRKTLGYNPWTRAQEVA